MAVWSEREGEPSVLSKVFATTYRRLYVQALLTAFSLFFGASSLGAQVTAPMHPGTDSNGNDLIRLHKQSYEERGSGVVATINFYLKDLGPTPTLIFDAEPIDKKSIVPLEIQGQLLNVLLGRLFQDHPDITRLDLGFGGGRESLFPVLGQALIKSKMWDASRGRPLHGRLGDVIVTVFNNNNVAAPLAQAFHAHGFSLNLIEISRIDIEKDDRLNGARIPVHIDDILFEANRLPR